MDQYRKYREVSPTVYADICGFEQVMDSGIKGLWGPIPRIAGPAFTVQLSPGDNLMMHSAIYEAPEGSIIVVSGCSLNFAVAGGNVCATALQRGIAGFVIDGLIRDIAEIRDSKFPVYARGVSPAPGGKNIYRPLKTAITCGGVIINTGDIIIADEEGILVLPHKNKEELFTKAKAKSDKDERETLKDWQSGHKEKIEAIINKKKNKD
jgi:regulator of RNase E activity RraA